MTGKLSEGRSGRLAISGSAALLLALALAAGAVADDKRSWKPLAADGIHDPKNPAIGQLQAPAEALSKLPAETAGDKVRWAAALEKGLIAPRASVKPGADPPTVLDLDILLDLNGSLPIVRFSHREHTLLLECSNCHEDLFKMERGASQISMLRILEGEQCGVCHGAVAFPLTECKRCHSVPHTAKPAASGAPR